GDEARPLPELVARSLRHEVGDFLQSVYATAALLQARLPAEAALERQLVGDLRGRAGAVKHVVDGIYGLGCPPSEGPGPADLALVAREAAAAAARQSAARVAVDAAGPLPVVADARLLQQAGTLLLLAACRSARREVTVHAGRAAPGEVEWVI